MPEKRLDLETLHYILEQLGKDFAIDCSKLIDTLIKSLSESILTGLLPLQNKKAFASVKVLLSLVENKLANDTEIESELPVDIIIQSIKYVLDCESDSCSTPNVDIRCNVASIVSSLVKSVLLQNSQESLLKVSDLYVYILKSLSVVKQCKLECLIFKLEILKSIYHVLTHTTVTDEFLKILKLNSLDECKLFANLVLHHSNDVIIQTLLYLVPEYINCFKSDKILEVIWKEISISMTHSYNEYYKVLTILCMFFDIYFEKSKVSNKLDLSVTFLEDVNYWKLLQFALLEKDHLKRKQGMFLLKKTLELLNSTNRNFVCNDENFSFYWNLSGKDELSKIYSEIVTCLEFLEEQQLHIIKPIFEMIIILGEKIIKCQKVSYIWILLLYKKALMHESTQISVWGFKNLLKLPEQFFSQEYIARETACLLVDTLSNISLYYNDGLALSEELSNFFIWIAKLNTSKNFFRLLIKQICSRVWSAEALFFVTHSLSCMYKSFHSTETQHFLFWGKEEISRIGLFISKALNTHNKIIRAGIQCQLLSAISILTDNNEVQLEECILLISRFSTRPLDRKTLAWSRFIDWLSKSYPRQKAVSVLQKFKKPAVGEEINEKFLSSMIVVFHDCFYTGSPGIFKLHSCDSDENALVSYVYETCLLFKEIDKRPYCNKLLYNSYLLVLSNLYEANLNDPTGKLLLITLPFAKDFVLYIRTQLHQLSNLEDFGLCQLYLKCFQVIIKTLNLFNRELLNDTCLDILKDTEHFLNSNTSSIGIYWRVKLLSILLELNAVELKPGFWEPYLLKGMNEPLKKDEDSSKKTRDVQTLWGKMNSEFLEGKWKVLEFLLRNKLVICGQSNTDNAFRIGADTLVGFCTEALDIAGYRVLCPVMSILKGLLPTLKDRLQLRRVVALVWKLVMEKRKSEEFKLFIKHFVQMLYDEAFIARGEFARDTLYEYADFIFCDSSFAVVNIFMRHVQRINLIGCSVPLFCHVTGKGLLFGPIQKKDERLTNQVCRHVDDLGICEVVKMGEYNTPSEIRARAVQLVLTLEKTSSAHRTAAKTLMRTLLEMEANANKNRIRYFGNSHVHRLKHRLMQALLLLEPFLSPNEDEAKELSVWLYRCLLSENSQPSVRYQQEWLLVRMLLRHSSLQDQHFVCNDVREFTESNKRGLCSVIAVSFHLCKLVSSESMERRIKSEIDGIFSLCFHQHFEVRLYAQVVVVELLRFAESMKLTEILKSYEHVITILSDTLKKNWKGNYGKNFQKLSRSFYFTEFNPLEHYSLETIYENLPRLSNIDLDECISTDIFESCGVDRSKIGVPLKGNQHLRGNLFLDVDSMNESSESTEPTELGRNTKDILGNYQKKIIPNKDLIPEWEKSDLDGRSDVDEEGLIVVASLIDRIPNLGGLARTCEIFGVSEFVVNSLKCTEDKQFISLSVTAEKWIKIKEVKIHNLSDYICEMKTDGYTVIGAEQALHSIPLGSAKFPKKSLLLLGNEKEGIPPNLLPVLDVCIEIPQLGIIRSLNVHVTGALFIWEYTKQNRLL